MSEKLKQCPFCKGEFAFDFEAKNFRCGTCGATVPPDPYARTVNTRPIEDELTTRIAELEKALNIDTDLTIAGLRKELRDATARIAELEAAQRWKATRLEWHDIVSRAIKSEYYEPTAESTETGERAGDSEGSEG
jgi:hypothetical protein